MPGRENRSDRDSNKGPRCETNPAGSGTAPSAPVSHPAGADSRLGLPRDDLSQRRRNEAVNEARIRLSKFYELNSIDAILQSTLDEIESLTGSQAGFYHFLDPDQKTLTLQNWSTQTLARWCRAEGKGLHYNVDQAGVWVDCVHERRPVIHNDYAALCHRKGLPEGHVPVIREMVIPVIRDGLIVAIIGMGNKEQDYDETDIDTATILADLSWNVVARKQAEARLQESEDKYRALIENSADIIARFGRDLRYLYASPTIHQHTGIPPAHFVGRTHRELGFPEKYCVFWDGHIAEVFRTQEPREREFTYGDQNGEVVFNWRLIPEFNAGGDLISVLSISRDITERWRARDGLRVALAETEHQHRNLQAIFSASPVGMILVNQATEITRINEAGTRLARGNLDSVLGCQPGDAFGCAFSNDDPFGCGHGRLCSSCPLRHMVETTLRTGTRAERREMEQVFERNGQRVALWLSVSVDPVEVDGQRQALVAISDITERRRMEEALRESECRYRTIFDSAGDAMFILDFSGRFLEVNRVACDRLGYSREEFLRLRVQDVNVPAGAAWLAENLSKVRARGFTMVEAGHRCKDGREIPVEMTVRVIEYGGNQAVLAIARDLSERKQAEKSLQESMQTSTDIVTAIPAGLFIFQHEPPGRFILSYCNPTGEQLCQRKSDELYGTEFEELWPRAGRLGLPPALLDCLRTGELFETEVVFERGEWLAGTFRLRAFRMARQRLGLTVENLTETRRLAAIAESFGAGILQVDHNHDPVYWNQSLLNMAGLPAEPDPWPVLQGLRRRAEIEDFVAELEHVREGRTRTVGARRFELNGKYLECSTLPLLAAAGEYRGALLIIRDITQDLLYQQDVIHREKMASLGVMVARIAHDINSPLGGMQNCIRRIREHPEKIEQTLRYAELMDAATQRMSGLVQQLLRFARREQAAFEPLNLGAVLEEALQFASKGTSRVEVRTDLQLRDRERLEVSGDFNALLTVFLNLLLNAYDAIAGRGEIQVRAWREADRVIAEIQDSGLGIAKEIAARVFESFFTTKAAGEGTGIGLSIARQVARQHQGDIIFETQPGIGTTFRIELPARPGT